MQVGTWILLPVLILQFLLFVSPILPFWASIPMTLLFVSLGALSARFAYVCCATDPIDKRLANHIHRQEQRAAQTDEERPDNEDEDETVEGGETKFCWVCQTTVHEHSMHCKFCDKCVSNFDHHCLWLNTCVGSANYPYFFRTVVSTFLFVLVHLAGLIGTVVPYLMQRFPPAGQMYDTMEGWFGARSSEALAGVNGFFLLVNLVSVSLLGQLLVFHIGLRKEGITTYAFIVRDNARKRDRSRRDSEATTRRMIALRDARGLGKQGLVCRLQAGGLWGCGRCDPIKRRMREEEAADKVTAINGATATRNFRADERDEDDDESISSSDPSPKSNNGETHKGTIPEISLTDGEEERLNVDGTRSDQ